MFQRWELYHHYQSVQFLCNDSMAYFYGHYTNSVIKVVIGLLFVLRSLSLPLLCQISCCLPGPVSESEARCGTGPASADRQILHAVELSPLPRQ